MLGCSFTSQILDQVDLIKLFWCKLTYHFWKLDIFIAIQKCWKRYKMV
jgi:hypothetical protein